MHDAASLGMARENAPDGAPLLVLGRAPIRPYVPVLWVLAAWLIASPTVLQYTDHPLSTSDRLSGALVAIVAALAWIRDRSALAWPAGVIGLWLVLSPIVLSAPTAPAYASTTLAGILVAAVAFVMPSARRAPGPAIPRGWSYNPSTWRQRAPVVVACLVGYAIALYLASFQLGYITTVFDPVFGDGARAVLTSDVARSFPVSDAGLGAALFLVDSILVSAGDERRWRTLPWLVLLFGVVIVPMGIAAIVLVILQPLVVGAWCSWCLLTAIASLVMIPLVVDEVAATLQLLRRAHGEGRSWTRVLWRGDVTGATESPVPARPAMPRNLWGLIALGLVGLWLVAEPTAIGTTDAYAKSTTLVGAALIVIAVISLAEVARPVRFAAVPLAAWTLIAPWLLSGPVPTAFLSAVFASAIMLAASLLRIPVREHHGELDRVALWPSLWWPASLIVSVIALLAVAACGPDPEPARPRVYAQLGSTHVTPPPDAKPPPVTDIPDELPRLAEATARLSTGPDPSHDEIVRALHELADAAAQFAPDRRAELEAIHRAADSLARSPVSDTHHAESTRYGLDAAVGLFSASRPWRAERLDDYARAVCLLGRATGEVDTDAPLLDQHRQVVAAFRAATAALYLGIGLDPPPGTLADEPCDVEARPVS